MWKTELEKAHLLKTIKYKDAIAYTLNDSGKTLAQEVLILNKLLNKIDKKLQTQWNWFEVDYQEEHNIPIQLR